MIEGYIDLNGVPTHLMTWGKWVENEFLPHEREVVSTKAYNIIARQGHFRKKNQGDSRLFGNIIAFLACAMTGFFSFLGNLYYGQSRSTW
jgi:hypothetical protein